MTEHTEHRFDAQQHLQEREWIALFGPRGAELLRWWLAVTA